MPEVGDGGDMGGRAGGREAGTAKTLQVIALYWRLQT